MRLTNVRKLGSSRESQKTISARNSSLKLDSMKIIETRTAQYCIYLKGDGLWLINLIKCFDASYIKMLLNKLPGLEYFTETILNLRAKAR